MYQERSRILLMSKSGSSFIDTISKQKISKTQNGIPAAVRIIMKCYNKYSLKVFFIQALELIMMYLPFFTDLFISTKLNGLALFLILVGLLIFLPF